MPRGRLVFSQLTPRWPRNAHGGLVSAALLSAVVTASVPMATAAVCGDANGDGSVTVTDGVVVLRAAAGLATPCTPLTCDVDGHEGITVTDGVHVLRAAAGLPNACDDRLPSLTPRATAIPTATTPARTPTASRIVTATLKRTPTPSPTPTELLMIENRGTLVMLVRIVDGSNVDTYIVTATTIGSETTIVASNANPNVSHKNMQFLPDGAHIIYCGEDPELVYPCFLITLAGDLAAVSKRLNRFRRTAVSPNGGDALTSGYTDGIYQMSIDGTVSELINTRGFTYDHCPTYSPSGRYVAVCHHEYGSRYYFRLFDTTSGEYTQVADYRQFGGSSHDEELDIQWLSELAFIFKFGNRRIGLVDLGNERTEVVFDGGSTNAVKTLDVSPDRSEVLYSAPQAFSITDTESFTARETVATADPLVDLDWANGSEGVVFTTRVGTQSSRIFYYDRSEGEVYRIPLNLPALADGGRYEILRLDFDR